MKFRIVPSKNYMIFTFWSPGNLERCGSRLSSSRARDLLYSPRLGYGFFETFTVSSGGTRLAFSHRPSQGLGLPADGKPLAAPNSVKVKISVVLPQSHRGGEKLRQVLFAEDRRFGTISKNPAFAEQNHALDFRDDL